MSKKVPMNTPSDEQIAHLNEHIDQFVALTGSDSVEKFFKEHPESSYTAVCEVMDLDPLPSPEALADQKAKEAFEAMAPRDHRKAATHLLMCPHDGLLGVLGVIPAPIAPPNAEKSVMGWLSGKSTGGMVASKVENLSEARDQIDRMQAMLNEAVEHIDAAIAAYKAEASS